MKNILLAILIAFLWALWPNFAQKYGRGHYVFAIISFGSFLAVWIIQALTPKQLSISSSASSVHTLVIPLALGVINGVAFGLYPLLLNNVEKPSTWVTIVMALLCVFSVLIGSLITKQISIKEVGGLCLVIAGIIMMMKK